MWTKQVGPAEMGAHAVGSAQCARWQGEQWGVVAAAWNSNTQEAEAGGSLQVPGYLGL